MGPVMGRVPRWGLTEPRWGLTEPSYWAPSLTLCFSLPIRLHLSLSVSLPLS